jgi:hypothetical protein
MDYIDEVHERRHGTLKSIPGVLNTFRSTKVTNGRDTGVPCIGVFVTHKVEESELKPEHIIPKMLDGVPTDVIELRPKTWTAGITPLSRLSPREQIRALRTRLMHPIKPPKILKKTQTAYEKDWDEEGKCTAPEDQGGCGCYDEQTEVLTKAGWKFWENVTKDDEIFCYDPSGEFVYYNPSALFVYDYDGDMVEIKGRSIDLLVTPNHNQPNYRWDESKRKISERLTINKAEDLGWYFDLPCIGIWKGRRMDTFEVHGQPTGPYCTPSGGIGFGCREGFTVSAEVWLRFLGVYLAEGYVTPQAEYHIGIAAVKEPKKSSVKTIVRDMPLRFHEAINRFVINDKRLCMELQPIGQAKTKVVPYYVKELPPDQINVLLNTFGLGDGQWIDDNQTWRFYTSSKQLADDLQELILKTGKWAKITTRERSGSKTKDGREIKGGIEYSLYVTNRNHLCIERGRMIRRKHYKGKVYCAEIPTHMMVVRRNGKPVISGNSCWVFGPYDAFQDQYLVKYNQVCSISKQHGLECSQGAFGCEGGYVESSLNFALTGVALTQDCPYLATNEICGYGLAPDWQKRMKKLKSWSYLTDTTSMKEALLIAPTATTMAVPYSFFNYTGGVYQPLQNDPIAGYHAVEVVGCSDSGVWWKSKNSWGPNWGEGGYFRILYGVCSFDNQMYMLEIETLSGSGLLSGEVSKETGPGELVTATITKLADGSTDTTTALTVEAQKPDGSTAITWSAAYRNDVGDYTAVSAIGSDSEYSAAQADPYPFTITGLPRSLTLNVSVQGDNVQFTGAVSGEDSSGETITITKSDKTTVQTQTTTDGSFSVTLISQAKGDYTAYATVGPDTQYVACQSPTVSYTVANPLQPRTITTTSWTQQTQAKKP